MEQYTSFIHTYFEKQPADVECKQSMLQAWERLRQCSPATIERWKSFLAEPYITYSWDDFYNMLGRIEKLENETGLHPYVLHALFVLCTFVQLKERYAQQNIAQEVFWATVGDLIYKMDECYTVHGFYGTFVAIWYRVILLMETFMLGRLQYQISVSDIDFVGKNGNKIKKGDRCYNIHIPGAGPLKKESVLDSIECARKFFGEEHPVLLCHTWLLMEDREGEVFLPGTNLWDFRSLFEMISYRQDEGFPDAWRVFGMPFDGDAEKLPQKTGIQKRLVAFLKKYQNTKSGNGIIFA